MAKRIGSSMRKTRYKLKKHYRSRGKLSLSRYFQEFAQGDKVNLIINSSVVTGRFYPRFHGLTGTVTGVMKGACYEVVINDKNKQKTFYIHPIHLSK